MSVNRFFHPSGLTVIFAAIFLGCGGNSWSERRVSESQQRGDRIVATLEEYKARTGEYPPSLETLIDGDSDQILPPVAGDGTWKYKVLNGGEDFELGFEGTENEPGCWYARERHEWWLDTK